MDEHQSSLLLAGQHAAFPLGASPAILGRPAESKQGPQIRAQSRNMEIVPPPVLPARQRAIIYLT